MRVHGCFLLLAAWAAAAHAQPAGIDRAIAEGPLRFLDRAVVGPGKDGAFVVPTTQRIQPAGEQLSFPGRPVDLALSPDGATLAIKNMDSVILVDLKTRKIVQNLALVRDGNSHAGLQWSDGGNRVWTTTATRWLNGALKGPDGQFKWDKHYLLPGPKGEKDNSVSGGFVIDEKASVAYVTLSRNNAVAIVDLASGEIRASIPVGIAPFGVLKDGDVLYVTNWGGRKPKPGEPTGPSSGSEVVVDAAGVAASGSVSIIDLKTATATHEIETQLHPCGMALAPGGARLYVANANSDSISVIDTAAKKVVATWRTRPMPDLPFGSAPNALAVSADGKTLYAANGGNNCIALIDTGDGRIQGLQPTGWYPGALLLLDQGKTLCVANTKGVGSRESDPEKMRAALRKYSGMPVGGGEMFGSRYHTGSVSFIATPDAAALAEHTRTVAVNMRLPNMLQALNMRSGDPRKVPVPTAPGEQSVFKHVVYIIKENRTYDQVFGDMKQGNGDPGLCHFGRDVTPNHHALAEEFTLFDNFYCNGVLSADGHQWTNEGYVTDYLEKSFGGFERSYPYEGDDALAYASSGFIWDHVVRKGFTFRDYGEMVKATLIPPTATWKDFYEDYKSGAGKLSFKARTLVRGLEPYICPDFIGFPSKVQDVYRAKVFLKELKEFEEKGNLPNFIIMLLPNDHTAGTREGMPTPRACVADNDLALGQIVDALSRTKFWPEMVIFSVEDDPQAGLDHVDGHRTVALCVSPYTRRGHVDSTHYNQTSLLRTMELIFGLSPMNQFTLASNPLLECFQPEANTAPYTVKPNQVPLDEMNPDLKKTSGLQLHYAKKSMEMPLDDIDQADEDTLNRILWHSVKGYDTPYPKLAPRTLVGAEAWPGASPHDDDDDDDDE